MFLNGFGRPQTLQIGEILFGICHFCLLHRLLIVFVLFLFCFCFVFVSVLYRFSISLVLFYIVFYPLLSLLYRLLSFLYRLLTLFLPFLYQFCISFVLFLHHFLSFSIVLYRLCIVCCLRIIFISVLYHFVHNDGVAQLVRRLLSMRDDLGSNPSAVDLMSFVEISFIFWGCNFCLGALFLTILDGFGRLWTLFFCRFLSLLPSPFSCLPCPVSLPCPQVPTSTSTGTSTFVNHTFGNHNLQWRNRAPRTPCTTVCVPCSQQKWERHDPLYEFWF